MLDNHARGIVMLSAIMPLIKRHIKKTITDFITIFSFPYLPNSKTPLIDTPYDGGPRGRLIVSGLKGFRSRSIDGGGPMPTGRRMPPFGRADVNVVA